MAREDCPIKIGSTWVAAADLSSYQWRVMRQSAALTCTYASTAGSGGIGILYNKPDAAGKGCAVVVGGVCPVEAGAAFAQGALLTNDSVGRLVTAYGTDKVIAKAAEAASGAGAIVGAHVNPPALVDADTYDEPVLIPVAAAQNIASGNLVAYDGDGYLCNANDVTAARFAGVADEAANNAAGADGDISCHVKRNGVVNLTGAALAAGDAGKPVYVGGAATITLTPGRMFAGMLAKYSSATVAPVDIEPAVMLSGDKVRLGVAAAKTITAGNLVGLDGDGYLVASNDATCVQHLGIAMDTQDNAAGLDGALTATVLVKGRIALTTTGALVTDKGAPAYVNSATAVKITPAGSALIVGVISEYIGATSIVVDLMGSAAINAKDITKVGVAATKAVTALQGVCLDADGYLVAMNDATAVSFWGIALETKNNAAGADGDLEVAVLRAGNVVLTDAGGAAAATDMGDEVWQSTNATTVTQTAGTILVGTIERVLGVASLLVKFKPMAKVGQRTDRQFTIPFSAVGAALNGVLAFADREFLRRYIVLSSFGDVQVAPGGASVLTAVLSDGTTSYNVLGAGGIAAAAVHGENKTAQVLTTATMLANTDTDLTLGDTGVLSQDLKGVINCEAL